MNPTELFLNILIKEARKNRFDQKTGLAVVTWIEEYRTIRLGVPRRTGKTAALIALSQRVPSLVITPSSILGGHLQKSGVSSITVGRLQQMSAAHCANAYEGAPLQLILLEEAFMMDHVEVKHVFQLVWELCMRQKVDLDNLVVVFIGT